MGGLANGQNGGIDACHRDYKDVDPDYTSPTLQKGLALDTANRKYATTVQRALEMADQLKANIARNLNQVPHLASVLGLWLGNASRLLCEVV